MRDLSKRFYREVGRRIREVRENDRGLTQAELGAAVALNRTSITNIELGRQKVLLHKFVEISNALSVEPQTLIPSMNSRSVIPKDFLPAARKFIEGALGEAPKKGK